MALIVVLGFTACLVCFVVLGAVSMQTKQEDQENLFGVDRRGGSRKGGQTDVQMESHPWGEFTPQVAAKGDIMFAIPEDYSVNFSKS